MFKSKCLSNKKFENNLPLNKRINPGIKFLFLIFSVIFIFLINSIFTQLILLVVLFVLFCLCGLKINHFKTVFKSFIVMFLMFTFINWFFYKMPIAFSVDGFNHLGDLGIMNKYDWYYSNNNIFISFIWGGDVFYKNLIDHTMVDYFVSNNMNQIDKWINVNGVDINQIVNAPSFVVADEQKKAFLFLLNNKFEYNGIEYDFQIIDSILSSPKIIYDYDCVVLFRTNWYTLSPIAIIKALYISLKIVSIVIVSIMLTETTTSIELSTGLEKILSPLRVFKFPVSEASMIIAIAIRFIPSLLSESKRILDAQAARGVDFRNGNLFVKLKSLVSLVVPLFSIAFRNAEELANAMDARGYNPKKNRSKYRIYSFSLYDFFLLFIIFFFGIFGTLFHYLNIFFVPFGIVEGALVF